MDFTYLCNQVTQGVNEKDLLDSLYDQLSRVCSRKPHQVAYIEELRSSSGSTASSRLQLKQRSMIFDLGSVLGVYLHECKLRAEEIRHEIDKVLSGGQSLVDATCQAANLYPRISPIFLLQRLTRVFWNELPSDWRICLVNYGLSLAYVQRAERLVNASRRPDRRTDLLKEL
jgi:hypothetical protein